MMKPLKWHLLSLLVTALVAGSFLSSAVLATAVNPFSLTLLRFLLAALMLLPLSCLNRNGSPWSNRYFYVA